MFLRGDPPSARSCLSVSPPPPARSSFPPLSGKERNQVAGFCLSELQDCKVKFYHFYTLLRCQMCHDRASDVEATP